MSAPSRWVLVTGGARRLGRACALELALTGWGLIIQYRSSALPAIDLLDELRNAGADAAALQADLEDPDACARLIREADDASGGKLIGVVNCAAQFDHDTIDTFNVAAFESAMRLNAMAPAILAKEFATATKGRPGRSIVNFLDFKLANPYPDHFSYTLSKFALAGATEMLARALAPGIRVNAVSPGYVLPAPDQSEADFNRLHNALPPLKRGATAEDVAAAVRYLLESAAVTGQTIYVDGGMRFRSFERDMSFM